MKKNQNFTDKIPRNPYKRQPSVPETPGENGGYFSMYNRNAKCVRFGRRKSMPAENHHEVSYDPSSLTFGMLDPNDKSFLRNAHKNLSMRLRNRGNTGRRKSMEPKDARFSKDSRNCEHLQHRISLTESFNLSKNKKKKVPIRERDCDVIFPPLTNLPSSKSADQLEAADKSVRSRNRRLSGLTEALPRDRRRNSTFSLNQPAKLASLNQSKSRNTSSSNKMKNLKSPVSTPSSGEILKKINERSHVRRASMPVVLVNGRKDYQKKAKKISPEALHSDEGIHFEVNRSSELRRSQQLHPLSKNSSQTRTSNQDHQNSIETRFETIMEISPNETVRHLASGVPLKREVTEEKRLTKEKLLSMEEDEDEEDRRWTERIRRWLEKVATGGEACQEVHDDVVTSYYDNATPQSPEFARANAIVVVYGEDVGQTC